MDYIKDFDWQMVSFVVLRLLQEVLQDPFVLLYGRGGKNRLNNR